MPDETTIQQVWAISLVVYIVVVIVVAVFLSLILMTARRIRQGAAAIWTVGQKVANNTIQIPLLVQTNHLVRKIHGEAAKVAAAVAAIERHAGSCPGCPQCVNRAAKGA